MHFGDQKVLKRFAKNNIIFSASIVDFVQYSDIMHMYYI